MTTICLQLKGTDPWFNLATEEYLLKHCAADVFMLWQSQNTIVVGKHQNALAEINHRYVREKGIRVARRLSGGGTVFHDEGNLNFTFIKNVERVDQINYHRFTGLMIGILQKLGLQPWENQHNAIFLEQRKISGSADHVHRNRVIHHGTLLFDSHIEHLEKALETDLSRFEHKAIQSNRSEVTNIKDHLHGDMTFEQFRDFIFEQVSMTFQDRQFTELSAEDVRSIESLKEKKYAQWDWIYGYSPKYRFRNVVQASGKRIAFVLSVEKGKIRASSWEGDLSAQLAGELGRALESQRHDYETLSCLLKALEPQLQQEGFSAGDLMEKLV